MKKYVKPDLFFESFQLDQHIASCALDLEFANTSTCVSSGDTRGGSYPVYGDAIKFFVEDNANCNAKLVDFCLSLAVNQEDAAFKVFRS